MEIIRAATAADKDEILKLYKTMLFGPADWDDDYPSMETIEYDLERDALFVMVDEDGSIIAAISIDLDEDVEILPCWDKNLEPGAELSRLAVREDKRNRGIARRMMQHVFDVLRDEGKKSVHILVREQNVAAFVSYEKLGYRRVGYCHLHEKEYVCMEVAL